MPQQSAPEKPKPEQASATQMILNHGDELTFNYQGEPLYRLSIERLPLPHPEGRAYEWRYHIEHVSGLAGRTALVIPGESVSLSGGVDLLRNVEECLYLRFGVKSALSVVVYLSRTNDAPFFAQMSRKGGQAIAKLH